MAMDMVIDGQFGSTGKGLFCGVAATKIKYDFAVTNAAPNAGHTCDFGDGRGPLVTRHLPIAALVQGSHRPKKFYLCAGAVIDREVLEKEITELGVDRNQIIIHPRAAVITPEDKEAEASGLRGVASTMKGGGAAIAAKVMRRARLAGDVLVNDFDVNVLDLNHLMDCGAKVLMEVPQGFDLGLNSGIAYPQCTSRDINVAQALSDAQVHPTLLGHVIMTVRTFPIRVGNIVDEHGKMIGHSGPFYSDSEERTFEELGQTPELTTVTKRVRRIATFSPKQYVRSINHLRPHMVFLNFVNYLVNPTEPEASINRIEAWLEQNMQEYKMPSFIGLGPKVTDVLDVSNMDARQIGEASVRHVLQRDHREPTNA